ncbi:MAG: 3,4-dihydroxy-2-butanone-4-phosphate synthase [Rhodobacteraceae bacterium]|nr:3,4-dihydroxy-2-butanone-4-phosphate synthase [Paracoccaceae bacterium]
MPDPVPFAAPGPVEQDWKGFISPTEEIIADARAGKMFILVDHENRENEGDLVIPAESADAKVINFMATHGRGLICLSLQSDRLDALGLPMMATTNSSRHETAFTVSIEARDGVTTGISAHDRAQTIKVAIDPRSGARDIATPGHVFPLRAREGGVLVRAGHTEAAVDVARLAGKDPSGVICEIMNDDGTMARLPDLVAFARHHGLKIGTISDLIAYRRRYDNLVTEIARRDVTSAFGGNWQMRIYADRSEGAEHVVMIKGDITGSDPVLVRTHALAPMEDVLGLGPGNPNELREAMARIDEEGRGVLILFRDVAAKLTPEEAGTPGTLRYTGLGAQIMSALGLRDFILLTDNPLPKIIGLEAYGLNVTGTRKITKG